MVGSKSIRGLGAETGGGGVSWAGLVKGAKGRGWCYGMSGHWMGWEHKVRARGVGGWGSSK